MVKSGEGRELRRTDDSDAKLGVDRVNADDE